MPRPYPLHLACAVLACLLLATAVPVHAETLRIAALNTAPYGFMQDGEPAGLACETALALAAGAGFEPATVLVSRAEALRRLASGEADMAVMPGGPPSDGTITNLGPVAVSGFIVLGRAGTALRTPRDLPGKTVATVRGAPEDPALSTRCGVAVLPVANAANCLKLLLAGRVDAAAGDRLVLLHAATAMDLPAKTLGDPLTLSGVNVNLLAATSLEPETAARLARALARLAADGTLDTISARYGL
jgi:polar amino acid transport system substrate-binding protein